MSTLNTLVSMLTQVFPSIPIDAQVADWESRGEKVALWRRLYDGDHPANMTKEMRKALRVAVGQEFNLNYAPVIIDTMADRINLDTVEADAPEDAPKTDDVVPASEWAEKVLEDNNIDAIQMDVHESTIRDSEGAIIVEWDNEEQRVTLRQQLAYDGKSGVVFLYQSADEDTIEAAIKVWLVTAENGAVIDDIRVNIYYPDRVVKKVAKNGGMPIPYVETPGPGETVHADGVYPWVDRPGQPLGIPIIPFRNKGRQNHGQSELETPAPLLYALDRVLHSIVMTSELSAFPIRWIAGAKGPEALTPGMIHEIGTEGLTPEQAAAIKIGEWVAGQMTPQLDTARWLTNEISRVSRTPAPEFSGGDNASGEALKQREIGLIGKVKRFQVKAGDAWCQVMDMAWKVQAAFGEQPPDYERFRAKWTDPEIRNDTATIDNALKLRELIGDREALRMVGPILHLSDSDYDRILAEKAQDAGARVAAMAAQLPSFANAQYDMSLNGGTPAQGNQPPMMNGQAVPPPGANGNGRIQVNPGG